MALQKFKSRVISREDLTKELILLSFSAPESFTFKAGQYVQLKIELNGETKWKSFSILNPPKQKGRIDMYIKLIEGGFASEVLKSAKPGDEYEIKGPLGMFAFDEKDKNDAFFICVGTGIVPIHSMLIENVEKHKERDFTLIFGARTHEEILYRKEFEELERRSKNFKYILTLSREEDWLGNKGHVQKYMPEDAKGKTFYLCGLKEMVLETKELLLKRGAKEENIKTERYN